MKINWQRRLYPQTREEMEKEELERLLRLESSHKFRLQYGGTNYRRLTEGELRSLEYLQKKYLGG